MPYSQEYWLLSSTICTAAHRTLKKKCLNLLVRPILKYRGSVWDPHQAGQIANLKIQKKGSYVCDWKLLPHFGSTAINIGTFGWVPHSECRARIKIITLHKANTGISRSHSMISPQLAENFKMIQSLWHLYIWIPCKKLIKSHKVYLSTLDTFWVIISWSPKFEYTV